jgi:hypothetical protein
MIVRSLHRAVQLAAATMLLKESVEIVEERPHRPAG